MRDINIDGVMLLLIFIAIAFLCLIPTIISKKRIDEKIRLLSNNSIEITPEEFFKMRNFSMGGKGRPSYMTKQNFSGIYILHNKTKDMYYVGQGKQVFNRVNAHFTGKGNGDVYADYKYGDSFTIKMISLENSGFNSLNELEKSTISFYDSFANGYNKTKGNK